MGNPSQSNVGTTSPVPSFLEFKALNQRLTADQLAGIQTALGAGLEAPPTSPTLAKSLSKQIDSIKRLSEAQNPCERRSSLLALAKGEESGGRLNMLQARETAMQALGKIMSASQSKEGRHVWVEGEEKELARLVADEGYRLEVLGKAELDYQKLGMHFHRTENAVRKKCWSMTMKMKAMDEVGAKTERGAPAANTIGKPATTATVGTTTTVTSHDINKKRKWTDEENREMQRLVESHKYRVEQGVQEEGSKTVKWGVLAKRFTDCKAGQAQKKFQSLKGMLSANGGVVKKDRKQNRKHHQKKVAYKWMIVSVMRTFVKMQGTALDIFEAIERNADFKDDLDMSIAPGTQQVPRWRTQVRKTLSAEKIFINTGAKLNKETVWELDINTVADLVADNPKQRIGDLSHVVPMMKGSGGYRE